MLGFTGAHLEIIRSRYDGSSGVIDELMEAIPGHPRWHFARAAQALGVAGTRPAAWSEDEIEYLVDHYGLVSLRHIARRLRRTETAVKLKAKRLGINQKANFYSATLVAEVFGVDTKKVSHQWIVDGLLRARRSPVRCGPHHVAWRVMDQDLERFIRQHPEQYDWRRMEPGPWRNIARATWERDPVLTAEQAARELGVNTATILRHINRGWMSATRVRCAGKHGSWRIRRSALEGFRVRKPDAVGNRYLANSRRRRAA